MRNDWARGNPSGYRKLFPWLWQSLLRNRACCTTSIHLKTFYIAACAKKSQVSQQNAEVELKLKIKARRERGKKERAEASLPWPYLRNIPVKILELFPRFASVSLSWGEKSPVKGQRHMYSNLYKGQIFLLSFESINFSCSPQQTHVKEEHRSSEI